MQSTTVISLGGSLIASDKNDAEFLKCFYEIIQKRLKQEGSRRFILVTGGGAIARENQRKYLFVRGNEAKTDSQDWIGIAATKNNAELVGRIFEDYCTDEVYGGDPEKIEDFNGRVLVASGWKPGRSTDYVAVALAVSIKADKVINLTNVAQVYSDDPRINPSAQPLSEIGWNTYRSIVGNEWSPGKNAPFDPIASKLAQENGMNVIIIKGGYQKSDLENLENAIDGRKFFGTLIHS